MNTDLQQLINQRLDVIDARRIRQEQPRRFCYVGKIVSGEVVDFPKYAHNNIVVIREGDPKPDNTVIYAWSWGELTNRFIDMTIKTGPNMWRWR